VLIAEFGPEFNRKERKERKEKNQPGNRSRCFFLRGAFPDLCDLCG
jgi:hypothetical protein